MRMILKFKMQAKIAERFEVSSKGPWSGNITPSQKNHTQKTPIANERSFSKR